MSWEANEAVRRRSKMKGSARLLMLVLSNYVDSKGEGAYPSIGTLMADTLLCDRAIRYLIRICVNAGELEVKVKGGPHGVNVYKITLVDTGKDCRVSKQTLAKTAASTESADRQSLPVTGKVDATTGNQASPQPAGAIADDPKEIQQNTLPESVRDGTTKTESDFERAIAEYPDRGDDGNPRASAESSWNATIARHPDAGPMMIEAARRYRRVCDDAGKTRTRYVMMAGRFFGPQECWRDFLAKPASSTSPRSTGHIERVKRWEREAAKENRRLPDDIKNAIARIAGCHRMVAVGGVDQISKHRAPVNRGLIKRLRARN